ncbi:MAG: DUF2199 domain-containing protein [Streptosporangiaceae bacterium]
MAERQCEMCGRPVEAHDRHVRFRLPEPVLASQAQENAPGAWLSHDSAQTSVMMQVPSVGAFVRALLPVSLTGGHTLTYGVWVAIDPRELQRAFAVWWEPAYKDLRLDGALANSIQPWGLLASPVSLAVRDPEQTPYCSASPDPELSRVLNDQWPHGAILDSLP